MSPPPQRWLRLVVVSSALVFVGVASWLYGSRFSVWLDSDAAVTALLGERTLAARFSIFGDWYYANGDVWVLAPHLFAVIPVAILGLGPSSLWVALVTGLVFELAVYARLYARLCGERWVGWFAALITLTAWSQAHVQFVYLQLAVGFLAMLYVSGFTGLAILATGPAARAWRWAAVGGFVALIVLQNPVRGLVFVVVPALVACAWPWRGFAARRRLALAAVVGVGWLIAAVIYQVAFPHLVEFSVPRGHRDFAFKGADGIVANLGTLWDGLALLCAGLPRHHGRAVPGALVLVGALALVTRELVAARTPTATRLVTVMVSAQLACVLAPLIVGTLLTDPSAVRYLMPSLLVVFGLAVTLAIRALGEPSRGWRRLAIGWLVVLPIAAVVAVPSTRPPRLSQYRWPNAAGLHALADELARRGLTRGFSDLINANLLNLEARGRSTTCPVAMEDTMIPQRWLTDRACFTAATLPARFYVVTGQRPEDQVPLGATLPAPIERFRIGQLYEVSVFRTADAPLAWLAREHR